jgi:hypothetical protein
MTNKRMTNAGTSTALYIDGDTARTTALIFWMDCVGVMVNVLFQKLSLEFLVAAIEEQQTTGVQPARSWWPEGSVTSKIMK